MVDELASGVLLIFALSVLAFAAGRQIRERRVSQCFFAALIASLLFAWMLSGKLLWASLLPNPAVVFLSNLMPVLLGFAAGLASSASALSRFSRPSATLAFVALSVAYVVTPYARPILYPVEVASQTAWRGDVCLQSHSSTCAPAAAVTLLALDGVPTTEREMVEACLTSERGTEPLGLYRGVAIAAHRAGFAAKVAKSEPALWDQMSHLPNISLVQLDPTAQSNTPRRLLGPRGGEGHAVVVMGRDAAGNWRIADPAFGMTTWTDEQFRSRFTGDAIYIVAR